MTSSSVPTYDRNGRSPAGEPGVRLSLQRIEDFALAEGNQPVPHRHPFHCQIMWIEAGSSAFFINGRVYRLRAGDLYCLPVGVLHACGSHKTLCGWMLHTVPEFLVTSLDEQLEATRRGNLSKHTTALASQRRWWEEFSQEYTSVRPGRKEAIRALLRLQGVFLRRLPQRSTGPAERPRPLSLAFRELLDAQYSRCRLPKEYAQQLGITTTQLRAHVLAQTGAHPRDHIDRRVMLEARRLLAFSATPIASVAEALGFENTTYFWKYFHKHAGLTPGEWREHQRQDFANAGAPGLELPF